MVSGKIGAVTAVVSEDYCRLRTVTEEEVRGRR